MTTQANKNNLEFVEPVDDCRLKTGTFYYVDPSGASQTSDFYVKVCTDDRDRQMEEYNDQFTDEWERLSSINCTSIRYEESDPFPI